MHLELVVRLTDVGIVTCPHTGDDNYLVLDVVEFALRDGKASHCCMQVVMEDECGRKSRRA
jgi:hypothetical protein